MRHSNIHAVPLFAILTSITDEEEGSVSVTEDLLTRTPIAAVDVSDRGKSSELSNVCTD